MYLNLQQVFIFDIYLHFQLICRNRNFMVNLITKSGNLLLQKSLFYLGIQKMIFSFWAFLKLNKNIETEACGSSTQRRTKFFIDVELNYKLCPTSHQLKREKLVLETLFALVLRKYLRFCGKQQSKLFLQEAELFLERSDLEAFSENLEITFLFRLSEWINKFNTHKIILSLKDLLSRLWNV